MDAQKLATLKAWVDGAKRMVFFGGDDTLAECAYGYGVTGIPMTFFIDKDGNLVSGKTGMISEADLERRIQTILG